MWSVALVIALAAPLKVAVPGIRVVGMDEKRAAFFNEHLAQQLADRGLSTITPDEIATLIGIERQRQLLACNDSSCTAELAGALGVDILVLGSAARIGAVVQLDLKALDSRTGARRASYSARVKADEELLEKLDEGARALAEQLGVTAGGEVPTATSHRSGVPRWAWIPPMALGAAAIITGIVLLVESTGTYGTLRGATAAQPLSITDADGLRSFGLGEQVGGWVSVLVGAAAVVVGGVLLIVRPASDVAVTIAPAPNGVGVVGVFP